MTWWDGRADGRDTTSHLLDLARANGAGERVGIYSVCSADRSVLRAALIQARRDDVISDRSRYYWPRPEVRASVERLVDNLSAHPIPLTPLSQCLPVQCQALRAGNLANDPRALIGAGIGTVVDSYARACGMGGG